jgi:signal transduction histidine kinase
VTPLGAVAETRNAMNELIADARLLIVDDNVSNICLLQNILSRLGFKVIETLTDSRETLAVVEEFQPDLIVLDLNMPHLDGIAVLQQLNRVTRETFLPVLMLTADATSKSKLKALAAGASDFLTKPFHASEVMMRIRNLLQIRFLQRQLREHNQTLESTVAERTRELQEMQQQVVAQERLRAFGEMAGGIVHDFNNALMSVIGYSDILLSDEELMRDPVVAREYLGIINTAGQDASHVIGRLRDFYRPRDVTDVFASTDVNEILEQAVPLTQPKWKGQALADGREIAMNLDLAKVPPVLGNAAELRELATNLIFNAADAMPHGGTITLRTGCSGSYVWLEVTDTGVGMTEEVRARCLEPFFSTKGEKGTGLGLSMVFGIVQRHDGLLEIESKPGKGTTFRIYLPVQVTSSSAEIDDGCALDRSLKVLVVDDEAVSRTVLASYLTADGHEVSTAVDAEHAIGTMHKEHFDLLITDHAMPGANGLQLASVFRASRAGHPIILVTGFAAGGQGPEDETPEVDLVMRKPVLRRELRRALQTVMAS